MGTLSDGADWHGCHCHRALTASHCCSCAGPSSPPLSQKVLGECAFNASFCRTKPVLGPPRCCFRENLFPFWKILQSCLLVIALSSWEEKRWNEKAGAGRKYRVCIGRAQGALLVCAALGNPWSLLTLCIILWKAVALLAGGGRWHQDKWWLCWK